ncbi:MAG TPA: hypothetical protein VLU23_08230 [Pseudolabrys sp.]|jgi:hypothetical protein|nr:hypothetical protein [Pseudolabrys sp.]
MTVNTYETTASSGFTRVAAYVERLFDSSVEDRPIEQLSQQPRPDPAARYLNRRYELSELMCQTINCGFWPH